MTSSLLPHALPELQRSSHTDSPLLVLTHLSTLSPPAARSSARAWAARGGWIKRAPIRTRRAELRRDMSSDIRRQGPRSRRLGRCADGYVEASCRSRRDRVSLKSVRLRLDGVLRCVGRDAGGVGGGGYEDWPVGTRVVRGLWARCDPETMTVLRSGVDANVHGAGTDDCRPRRDGGASGFERNACEASVHI